jgi:hypothetical protein
MVVKQKRLWLLGAAVTGIFLLLYAALLARERRAIREEVFREIEWHAISTVDLLLREARQIGPLEQFFARLRQPDAQRAFDRLVRTKLGHLGLMKAKLYDARGQIIYATDPDLIGEFMGEGEGFQRALAGEIQARYISPGDYEAEYGEDPPPIGMAEAYVPVRFGDTRRAGYVFESYRDFTPFQARLDRLWRESAITLGLLLAFAYTLVVGVVTVNRRLLRRITALEGLLPICACCKKIRVADEGGPDTRWVALEAYFHGRAQIDFTHGICPDCGEALYGDRCRRSRQATTDVAVAN